MPAAARAIIENAVEAASQDLTWKALDRYSRAYSDLRTNDKVTFHRTPDSVLRRQLVAYDAVAATRKGTALFAEIEASQKTFAERAVRWQVDTVLDGELAYRHYFGPKPAETPRKAKK